jgi:hypothetical protein
MPTTQERLALSKTLEQAGIAGIRPEKIKWLAFSDAHAKQNEKVHRATNDLLLQLLMGGDTGRCIHVTGEMRALLDPFHRALCAQMHKQSGKTFSVLYNLPKDKRGDPNKTIGWSLKKWHEKGTRDWQEHLRTFDAIGERAVDLRASNTEHEIQYSVFGNKYIQLQGQHVDAAKAKRIWLLESEILNEVLTDRGERLLGQSTDIDERWYRRFITSLSGLGARLVLRKLADAGPLTNEELDDRKLRELDDSTLESATALKTMGFVRTDNEKRWTITPRGKNYLEHLMRT